MIQQETKSKLPTVLLSAVAATCLGTARWLYPEENHFSIMRCTISFLGSPDAGHNPHGFLWYQAGMTVLLLLLTRLSWRRHRNFHPFVGRGLWVGTSFFWLAFLSILLAAWVPDSRELHWAGIRLGEIHLKFVFVAIGAVMLAVISDGVVLARNGFRRWSFWPFWTYGLLWVAAIVSLWTWERKCERDPGLHHWPGDGIHSTPMWEWIQFASLILFLVWISRPGTATGNFLPRESTTDGTG